MAMIELVDFNEIYNASKTPAKKTTRRSRGKKTEAATTTEAPAAAETKPESTEE